MSTYISGPMRGIKHLNFPAFRECETYLAELGMGRVFNPARYDAEVLGMGWEPDETQEITEAQMHEWMRKDLTEVAACQRICLLPGWEQSEGARREVQVARWCGLEIIEYEPDSPYGYRLKPLLNEDVDAILEAPLDKGATVEDVKPQRMVPGLDPECWGREIIEGTDLQQAAFDAAVSKQLAAKVNVTQEAMEELLGGGREVRSVNPLTGGEKGVKPERYDLIPVEPLRQVARIYGYGAAKYADRNWEQGYEWSKSYAALQRHANAFWGGEDIDPESGLPHLASVVFHALAMLEWASTHPELDDRPHHALERAWFEGLS